MCYILYVIPVNIGKGKIITIEYGNVEITIYTAAGTRCVRVLKVLYILDLSTNLLLIESLRQKGVFYRSDRQHLFIKYTDSVDIILVDVYIHNRLPYLVIQPYATALVISKTAIKAEATILV